MKAGAGARYEQYRLGVRGQRGTMYREDPMGLAAERPTHEPASLGGLECLCRSFLLRLLHERYGV